MNLALRGQGAFLDGQVRGTGLGTRDLGGRFLGVWLLSSCQKFLASPGALRITLGTQTLFYISFCRPTASIPAMTPVPTHSPPRAQPGSLSPRNFLQPYSLPEELAVLLGACEEPGLLPASKALQILLHPSPQPLGSQSSPGLIRMNPAP